MADEDRAEQGNPVEENLRELSPEDGSRDQRLFRVLFEDSLGLMCVHDLEGVLLTVNPAAAASLGYTPAEGIGVNLRCFLAPEVQPGFDAYLEEVRRNRTSSGLMRLRARDGSERIWLYRNVLYEEPGLPPRVLGHAQDITERVRAEKSLKESEQRFRSLADTAPVFVWMCDTKGLIVFVNKPWLDFRGRTFEEEIGVGWFSGLHPDDVQRVVAVVMGALGNPGNFSVECRIRRADGQYRWILSSGTPRYDAERRFAGYVGTCVDVTDARADREALRVARDELAARVAERTRELVAANEALRQSEQHYQVLAELSPVGIFRTDNAGRCIYVNEQACRIAGLSPDDVRAGRWNLTSHPDDRLRLAEVWRNVLSGGGPTSLEHRFQHRDGSTVWALAHFTAERGPDGEVTGCIGTVADISDRKLREEENRRLEAQIQHAQRLQSLGILAGGVAHDFNNLLTIILGNARVALMEMPAGSTTVERLAEIETAASRAAELTSQMLAYSGKGHFVVQALNLSRLTEETASLLESVISKKTLVQYDLANDLPAIEADPAQIRQIVMNLITNASEAMADQGGVICVRTGLMHADAAYLASTYFAEQYPPGPYVYLEVTDTGRGMNAETQARIFEPFFTTKFTGRGLGLAAVAGIVRAHRGALKVSSRLGAGSTFRLLFPASGRHEDVLPQPQPEARAYQDRGAILVVDDEPGVRNLARLILEKSGFTVIVAGDGGEAVEVFSRHADSIAAALIDLTMPVMSGDETIAALRRVRSDVPMVLSSGYGEHEMATRFAGKGVAGFLKKPYEPSELLAILEGAIARRVVQ